MKGEVAGGCLNRKIGDKSGLFPSDYVEREPEEQPPPSHALQTTTTPPPFTHMEIETGKETATSMKRKAGIY